MPMFTYTPQWENVRNWFKKFERLIPRDYTGLAAIRLHRTGNPLTLELLGPELPETPLYPLLLLELENGKPAKPWEKIEEQYEVPWARDTDATRYGKDVMSYYHAEDLLEPTAIVIIEADEPAEETLRKALIDRAKVAARSR